jgi:hypothetical protein
VAKFHAGQQITEELLKESCSASSFSSFSSSYSSSSSSSSVGPGG